MSNFFQEIAVNVVGGLTVALILEWLRARWARATFAREGAPRDTDGGPATASTLPRPPIRIGRMIGRVVLSVFFGFFIGAILDGFYEAAAAPTAHIEFGDPASFAFIAVGTVIAWLLLSMLGRLFRSMFGGRKAGAR